jgi:hypothetical protein
MQSTEETPDYLARTVPDGVEVRSRRETSLARATPEGAPSPPRADTQAFQQVGKAKPIHREPFLFLRIPAGDDDSGCGQDRRSIMPALRRVSQADATACPM